MLSRKGKGWPTNLQRHLRSALTGSGARDLAENRPSHQASAARIIEIEQSADQFAGSVKPSDGLAIGIDHATRRIDFQPPKGERNAAGHCVSLKWRLVDRVGPVRLVDSQALSASAILDVRVEFDVGAHRLV